MIFSRIRLRDMSRLDQSGLRVVISLASRGQLRKIVASIALTIVTGHSIANADTQDPFLMDKAFISAQRLQYSETAEALNIVSAQFAAKTGPMSDLIRQNRNAKQKFKVTNNNLTAALADVQAGSADRAQSYRKQLDELQEVIEQTEAQIAQSFPKFSDISSPPPLSITQTQSFVQPNEAVLLMIASEEASFIWAVSQDKASWARVPIGKAQTLTRIQTLRQTLSFNLVNGLEGESRAAISPFEPDSNTPEPDFAYEEAHLLYQQLLLPVEDVIQGKAVLGLVTDDTFSSLPFAALVTKPVETETDRQQNTSWLIETHALYQLPSLTSLKSLRETAGASPGRYAFLGVGDPCLGQSSEFCRSGQEDTIAMVESQQTLIRGISALPRLPNSRLELMALADYFDASPGDLLMAGDATETNLKSEEIALNERRVIVFATHGLRAGEIEGLSEPALVLTPPQDSNSLDDGLLSASEIASLSLDADWVILSACNTASADGRSGARTFSGLAQAFFYSGTRSILLSHWSVRDDAAANITTGTISRLQNDAALTRAEALQQSMIALMKDPSRPGAAHPRVWAPFALLGDSR